MIINIIEEGRCWEISLSRIVIFIIGAVLAIVGLFLIINNLHDLWSLAVGGILLAVGCVLLSGRVLTV